MSNSITIFSGTTAIPPLATNAVLLHFDREGIPWYYYGGTYYLVDRIEASLTAAQLIIDTDSDHPLEMNYITMTTISSGEVSSLISWEMNEGTEAFRIEFTSPGSGKTVTWEIGPNAPPIRLKVILTRN